MRATALLLVLAMAVASGCVFGGSKHGPRGTNTTDATGSGYDGPWSGGTTAAATQRP